MTNNKRCVYTCITGGYDDLVKHSYTDPTWDYICFTDSKKLLKQKSFGNWEIRELKYKKLDNTKNARWHKTHPHILFPEYEESLWLDGNIDVKTNKLFNEIEEKSKYSNILIPIHDQRTCVYEECNACIERNKDSVKNIKRAKEFLEKNNMPQNYGMNETNIIYRRHNDKKIIKLMEDWFFNH